MRQLLNQLEPVRAKHAVFEAGAWEVAEDFQPYVRFASGEQANNKLLLDRLVDEPRMLRPMVKLAEFLEPDAVWGQPSGGQAFAERIAEELDVPLIRLKKDVNLPGIKTCDYASDKDYKIAHDAGRTVGIEDVGNEFTSLYGTLRLSPRLRDIARSTGGIVMGWRRGSPARERELDIDILSVVHEYIPNMVTPDSLFFKRYGEFAVRRAVS